MVDKGIAENVRIRDRKIFNKAAAVLRHLLPDISRAGKFFGFGGHNIKVATDSGVVEAMSYLVLDLYERVRNPDLVELELLQLRVKVHILERERDFWKGFAEAQRFSLEGNMTDAEARAVTYRIFEKWLVEWREKNPGKDKPTGNEAFIFYCEKVAGTPIEQIPRREWQEVHVWLRERRLLSDG